MRNGEYGGVLEDLADARLKDRVRLVVDGGGRFVKDDDLGLAEHRPSQADEL